MPTLFPQIFGTSCSLIRVVNTGKLQFPSNSAFLNSATNNSSLLNMNSFLSFQKVRILQPVMSKL